jgi:anti-sigma factor RsiW
MKKDAKTLNEKLQHYLDGTLSHDDKVVIEKLLLADDTVKQKYENLLMIDQFLRETKVVNMSGDFTQRVMSRVEVLPVPQSRPIRFPLIFLMVIVALISISVLFVSSGMFDESITSVDPNALPFLDQYILKHLPTVSLDGKILMKVMIFLNAALVLIFLDRAVLKPFFQRRLTRRL